ncbi:hypothetical protein LTR56_012002 [Elasticomyces elasticus]|nr:hypothetical protein LTR22_018101 [Elasticomyces elasticus]KAK3640206.1 hypothetical protein LTR56_012002 [Elasticomyces elasticus]
MVPLSTYVWTTVAPSFLSEHAFDVANMSATLDKRAETKVWGLDPSTNMGYRPVGTPSSSDLGWVSDFERYAVRIQKDFINNGRSYVNLTRLQCLEHYTGFERDWSDVLLVATNDLLDDSTNLFEAENSILAIAMQLNLFVGSTAHQNLWECGTSNSFNCYKRQSWLGDASQVADWNTWGYKIDYCLAKSQYLGDKCNLSLDVPIMIIVCIANLIKCLRIYYTTYLYANAAGDRIPLSTLDDAAVSFLTQQDKSTASMSLAGREIIDTLWQHRQPRTWIPKRERWYSVSSLWTWLATLTLCTAVLLLGLTFFVLGLVNTAAVTGSRTPDIATLGFGIPSQFEKSIGGGYGSFMGHPKRALYASVAWANSWQLMISILYVQYNTQLTAFAVGVEWSRFAHQKEPLRLKDPETEYASNRAVLRASDPSLLRRLRGWCRRCFTAQVSVRKTLRVSAPRGLQRSSYFVSMPWRYGIPLISSMALLHWLMSQSLFVVAAVAYGGDGIPQVPTYTSAYSLEAIVVTACVGFTLICALVVLGMQRYSGTIPLASSCSAAISAACHPPEGDFEAALFRIQWGVVSVDEHGVGHCSLTTARDVLPPELGQRYA